jgi:hypothetical protein
LRVPPSVMLFEAMDSPAWLYLSGLRYLHESHGTSRHKSHSGTMGIRHRHARAEHVAKSSEVAEAGYDLSTGAKKLTYPCIPLAEPAECQDPVLGQAATAPPRPTGNGRSAWAPLPKFCRQSARLGLGDGGCRRRFGAPLMMVSWRSYYEKGSRRRTTSTNPRPERRRGTGDVCCTGLPQPSATPNARL